MEFETVAIAAGLAPILVILVSFLKNIDFPSIVNIVVAIILSLAAAVISLVAGGTVDSVEDIDTLQEIVGAAGITFATAQVIYHGFFKNMGLNMTLEKMLWSGRGTSDGG